jgi:hypothetical protein
VVLTRDACQTEVTWVVTYSGHNAVGGLASVQALGEEKQRLFYLELTLDTLAVSA